MSEEYSFQDFITSVDSAYAAFTLEIHEALLNDDNCRFKVEKKASGFFVSYSHPKTKRSVLNFLFRKSGLLVRIYADCHNNYPEFIKNLPDYMEKEINKSPNCKRFLDPPGCNPKCVAGYDFSVGENRYKKCRFGCFQFSVNEDSIPIISELINKERHERNVV